MRQALVVIFATSDDVHALAVKEELLSRKADVVIVDLQRYGFDWKIDHKFQNDKHRVLIDLGDRTVSSEEVNGIWWRRKYSPTLDADLDPMTKVFVRREIDTVLRGWLRSARNIINPVENGYRANNKVHQLKVAIDAGFRVPSTLVTSDQQRFIEFRKNSHSVVNKPLNLHPTEAFPINFIMRDEDIDTTSIEYCPSVFQEAVLGGNDYRVTVVDSRIFGARIVRPEGFDSIDWRTNLNVVFEEVRLSDSIESSLLRYMNLMGLRYGAFDLRTNSDGEYFFLECNEAGQFLFVEIHGEIPISESVANALLETS